MSLLRPASGGNCASLRATQTEPGELAGNSELRLFEGAGELQIGPGVELAQLREAELPDPLGRQFAAGACELRLDPSDDRLDRRRFDGALVRGPQKRGAELRVV